uniref:Uncharacterized protein n=1 Tax=Mus musculus TaxID=10090 RepID=Q8C955_MOUSE|nr:unnamed protein product [Mus musculus]
MFRARISFKTSQDRVQAQNSIYALQFTKPKSRSHSTVKRSKLTQAGILDINSRSGLKNPNKANPQRQVGVLFRAPKSHGSIPARLRKVPNHTGVCIRKTPQGWKVLYSVNR